MARRKKVVTTVEVGDTITMRDWNGQWLKLTVKTLGNSPEHGPTAEGIDEEHQYRALPLSHKIEVARVRTEGRGKWFIELPDGTVEEAKSKVAAQQSCAEHGVVMQEV